METNSRVDLFLLNKFQKVSDWVQDYFCYDNFDIAKLCNIMMFILWVSRLIFSIFSGLKGFDYFYLPFTIIFCYVIKIITERVALETRNNPTFTNYAVLKYSLIRTIVRFILVLAIIFLINGFYEFKFTAVTNIDKYKCLKHIFWNMFHVFIFLHIYFLCCTPKPKKPSKVRNLLNKFKESINLIFEKKLVPKTA